jgi:hypothetical protein
MLGRIATGLMLRRWALAAAGVGLLVMIAVATAPRPACHCAATPAMAVSEPTPTMVRVPSRADCVEASASTRERIREELTLGRSLSMPARDAYLYLMAARALDCTGELTAGIDGDLARIAPRAAVSFMANKDYQNAAAAVMVANSLGATNATTTAVERALARTPYPRD